MQNKGEQSYYMINCYIITIRHQITIYKYITIIHNDNMK